MGAIRRAKKMNIASKTTVMRSVARTDQCAEDQALQQNHQSQPNLLWFQRKGFWKRLMSRVKTRFAKRMNIVQKLLVGIQFVARTEKSAEDQVLQQNHQSRPKLIFFQRKWRKQLSRAATRRAKMMNIV